MEMNLLTPAEAVYWGTRITMQHGRVRTSRGMEHLEIQNATFHIRFPHLNPLDAPGRNAKPAIGALEAVQLVGQLSHPESVTRRVAAFKPYLDDGIFWGAYGTRVVSQLSRAERLLRQDPGTRQAVVSIYDGQRDLLAQARDVPCTLTLQFLWEAPMVLGLRASMRSNDAFLGLPYDLFQFTALQCAMADALGARAGAYVHTVGSLHLYLRDREAAERITFPGEPLTHETEYVRKWNGDTIGVISERARDLLFGYALAEPTEFEQYLQHSLERITT